MQVRQLIQLLQTLDQSAPIAVSHDGYVDSDVIVYLARGEYGAIVFADAEREVLHDGDEILFVTPRLP